MKLLVAAIVLVLIVETTAQWYKFPGQAYQGKEKQSHKNREDVDYLHKVRIKDTFIFSFFFKLQSSSPVLLSGSRDMWRAYKDMREANWKVEGTDKYFHARGNYDAARRGPGGRWAATVIR